jgi:hypothetical protein
MPLAARGADSVVEGVEITEMKGKETTVETTQCIECGRKIEFDSVIDSALVSRGRSVGFCGRGGDLCRTCWNESVEPEYRFEEEA